jgi:hypothetical protein
MEEISCCRVICWAAGFSWILNVLCRVLRRLRFWSKIVCFVLKNLGLDLDPDPDFASISLETESTKCLDPDPDSVYSNPKHCW